MIRLALKTFDRVGQKEAHMKIDAEQDIFQDTSANKEDVEKRE